MRWIVAIVLSVSVATSLMAEALYQSPYAKPKAKRVAVRPAPKLLAVGTTAVPKRQKVTKSTLPPSNSIVTADTKAKTGVGMFALLDLRPSYLSNSGAWYQENWAELGVKFGADTKLSYVQLFNNNLYDPTGRQSGPEFLLMDGFVRGRFANLLDVPSSGFSISYEARAYLPTRESLRSIGMITSIRNYVMFKQKLSDNFSFNLWEVPIPHIFSQAGGQMILPDGTQVETAAPVFENRVYFVPELSLANGKVLFDFTLVHSAARYRDYKDSVKLNNDWGHILWAYPEFTVEVSPGIALGVAYETESLISPDFSTFTIRDGLQKGAVRGVLQLYF